MSVPRLTSLLAPAAFACFALALGLLGAIPGSEVLGATLAVAAAFIPAGLISPAGWRRRAAEISLLPLALVLSLVGDPAERGIVIPPLLLLAALGAVMAAAPRASDRQVVMLAACLGAAVRAATSTGLLDAKLIPALLAVVAAVLLPAATARVLGFHAGLLAAALAGALPLYELHPGLLGVTAAAALAATRLPAAGPQRRWITAWFPAVLAVAIILTTLSPWGAAGLAHLEMPGPIAALALAGLLAASRWLPPPAAGAAWLAASVFLFPGASVDIPGPAATLDAGTPTVTLPFGDGGLYAVDVTLANAATVTQGTPVAEILVGSTVHTVRAGIETAEWAHERADVHAAIKHGLPTHPVWRPIGVGARSEWAVAGRMRLEVPRGTAPVVRLSRLLPETSRLVVTGGPAGQSQRNPGWGSVAWLAAAAFLVVLLQLAGGAFAGPGTWLPWALLVAGSLAAHSAVLPLASIGRAAAPELALGAMVVAWFPAARRWFARRRFFPAAAAILIPLAAATPLISPPLGDDNYHLLLMESLTRDGDLDIADNFDLSRYPNQAVYQPFHDKFLHSPVLAVVLAPGYLLAGRSGAAVILALAGAALLALVSKRAFQLGVPASKVALAATVLLFSYPLTTFSTQLWTEVPGALLALACAVPWAAPSLHRSLALLFTLAATILKTRLALVTLPPTVAAWAASSRRTGVLRGLAIAAAVAATAWVIVAAILGDPLDPMGRRNLGDLLPGSLRQSALVLGGLAFDAAGGLAFSAPLLLVSLLGLRTLWRRGGTGERALLLGGALTLLALLHVVEWRGGESPPARYLVPLWGCLALAAAVGPSGPHAWRALLRLLVPPSVIVWWVGVTRPHWLVNVGDGGFWLGDILSARLGIDALDLFPSFLRPSPARWLVPAVLATAAIAAGSMARHRPAAARLLGRATAAVWLLTGTATLAFLGLKTDRVVEIEDPQVERFGGQPEPPAGTFSRFLQPNGVRLHDRGSVEVPVRLSPGSEVTLEGWLDDEARRGATIWVGWGSGDELPVQIAGEVPGAVRLPLPVSGGRGCIRIRLAAARGGSAVLDRIVISTP